MGINWGNLVEKGRAKAHGVPWSEEELHALNVEGVPPEFVRQGILTKAAMEPVKDSKQRKYKKAEDLRSEAKSLGIDFTAETTRQELIELIEVKVGESGEGLEPLPEAPADNESEETESPESPELSQEGQETNG